MKVSNYVKGAVRQFSYWFFNGTLGYDILEGIDYLSTVREEPSCGELAFAIFMNNLEVDSEGKVLNYKYCENRAAEYIKRYHNPNFSMIPKLEQWETNLHPVSEESYTY